MPDTPSPHQDQWLLRVLGVQIGENDSTHGDNSPVTGVVAYRKALLSFRAARSDVSAQLQALGSALVEAAPEEADLAQKLAQKIEEKCDRLSDAIDAGINAIGAAKSNENAKLKEQIANLIDDVESDALVAHIDASPVYATTVSRTLAKALERVAATVV